MTKGYLTRRPITQIDRNFRNIGKRSIDMFIEQNFVQDNDLIIDAYIPNHKKYLEYMNDRGNGRISQGVRSLEAITKTFRGIPSGALVLFNQVIISNPFNFKTMGIEDSRITIIQNLGLESFIQLAALESIEIINNLNNMMDRMFKDMKNFTFTFDNYINEALPRCKSVVNAYINYNIGRS